MKLLESLFTLVSPQGAESAPHRPAGQHRLPGDMIDNLVVLETVCSPLVAAHSRTDLLTANIVFNSL